MKAVARIMPETVQLIVRIEGPPDSRILRDPDREASISPTYCVKKGSNISRAARAMDQRKRPDWYRWETCDQFRNRSKEDRLNRRKKSPVRTGHGAAIWPHQLTRRRPDQDGPDEYRTFPRTHIGFSDFEQWTDARFKGMRERPWSYSDRLEGLSRCDALEP